MEEIQQERILNVKNKPELKKAIELKKTSTIINSDSIIITQEYKYKQANGIPIIEESDLDTITKIKDLKKLISER